jgi:hypothetical protein
LHEAGALRDAVAEAHRRCVGFVGVPVDARAAIAFSDRMDVLDQLGADA